MVSQCKAMKHRGQKWYKHVKMIARGISHNDWEVLCSTWEWLKAKDLACRAVSFLSLAESKCSQEHDLGENLGPD